MGMEVRSFLVMRSEAETSGKGRSMRGAQRELCSVRGILSHATAVERDRWKQLSHWVTHKVVVSGVPEVPLRAGDVLLCGKEAYTLSGVPYDVGDLHYTTILYCEVRKDLYD